jgi:signal transduction histidine kinase
MTIETNVDFMAQAISDEFKSEEFREFWKYFMKLDKAIERAKGWDISYTEVHQAINQSMELISEREEKELEEEERRLEEEDRLADSQEPIELSEEQKREFFSYLSRELKGKIEIIEGAKELMTDAEIAEFNRILTPLVR